jgi:ABC-type protease/lipase transport system fused ATPase/permease subunit
MEDEILSPISNLPSAGGTAASPSSISNLQSPGEAALHPISHIPSTISAQRPLRPGECLGLIGRNGASKTTLHKMLNGLINPNAGRIEMFGTGRMRSLRVKVTPVAPLWHPCGTGQSQP